jgi:hypothetical protein
MRPLWRAKLLTESMSSDSTTARMMWSGPKMRSVPMSTPSCSASCGIWLAPYFSICRVLALEVGQRSGGCSAMTANVAILYLRVIVGPHAPGV